MIRLADIKPYMIAMAAFAGANLARRNQSAPRQAYPYILYSFLVHNQDDDYQRSLSIEGTTPDADGPRALRTQSWRANATLEIAVFSEESQDAAQEVCEKCFGFVHTLAGRALANTADIVFRRISSAPEDRTSFRADGRPEFQWGFDLRVHGRTVQAETVEVLETASISGTAGAYPPQIIEVTA